MLIEDSTVAYEIFVRVSEGLAGEEAEDAVEDVQRGLHELPSGTRGAKRRAFPGPRAILVPLSDNMDGLSELSGSDYPRKSSFPVKNARNRRNR